MGHGASAQLGRPTQPVRLAQPAQPAQPERARLVVAPGHVLLPAKRGWPGDPLGDWAPAQPGLVGSAALPPALAQPQHLVRSWWTEAEVAGWESLGLSPRAEPEPLRAAQPSASDAGPSPAVAAWAR